MPATAARKPQNSAKKTATRGKPFTKNDPRAGVGLPGRSGRKPDEFKALCAELVSSAETLQAAREILANPQHPAYASVFKAIAPYGYGQPTQAVQLSGEVRSPVVLLPALDGQR